VKSGGERHLAPNVMTIGELIKAVEAVLARDPAPSAPGLLAQKAQQVAAVVGWAPGAIDGQGRLDEILERLQEQLKARFLSDSDSAMAELHDALGDLRQAIAEHDLHFEAPRDEDDDYLFI
jgi:hypothetical protein